ncbi:MAG: cadherin-like beta sandwich domain-containing protein [Spirochaetaceae bacterium]|jgi:hypothetical protein|nr:cadherin-like beta sandwich domain-containing protein [Spirochaetaceae bacterium]
MDSLKRARHSYRQAAVFMVGTAALAITAALWFASCDPEIENIITEASPPPRLTSLELDNPALILSPAFAPEIFSYSVTVEGKIEPVNITATANNAAYLVETPLGLPVTPMAGNIALVTVSDSLARKQNYYIQFVQNETGLPAAKLSDVTLSVGNIPDFLSDTTVYHNISIPYGVSSVTVFPAGGQEGSYFNYDPSATVVLNDSGNGTVKIGVIASGYTSNEYTLNFKRADGEASELGAAGIVLSSGALAESFTIHPGEGEVQTILVPYNASELTVLAVKKNWSDVIRFDSDEPSDGKHFTGPLNGTAFRITVNCGLGYSDRTYQFNIQTTAAGSLAVLTGLSFGAAQGINTTVYQHAAAGENAAEGFNAALNLYDLYFEHEAPLATITATAEEGAAITVTGVENVTPDNPVTISVDSLASSRTPVKLIVSADGRGTNEYTIFFRKSNPPYALLDNVTITGIKGPQPAVPGVPAAEHTFNNIPVYSNIGFVLVNAAVTGSEYQLRYENSAEETQKYLLAPNIDNGYIKVYVSGGGDYQESVYTFNFTVLPPLVPRLSTLRVNGGDTITGAGHDILAYTGDIAFSSGETPVQFAWTVDSEVVSKVEYSLTYGTTWVESTIYSGSLFSLPPAQSKVALIRVTTHDGAQAVYNITVTKAGDGANQLSALSVTQHGIDDPPELLVEANAFAAGKYAYALPIEVSAVDIAVSWPASAALYRSIDGAAYTEVSGNGTATLSNIQMAIGTATVVNLQVRPQQQESFAATYTLTMTRRISFADTVISNIVITSPDFGGILNQPDQTTGFNPEVYEYTAPLSLRNSATISVTWPAGCVVTYTIDGNLQTLGSSGSSSITVNNLELDSPPKPLTLVVQSGVYVRSYTILFTNSSVFELSVGVRFHFFTPPFAGQYRIECWGAQGGSVPGGGTGGRGGYSAGTIPLQVSNTLIASLGEQGGTPSNENGGAGGEGEARGAPGGRGYYPFYGGGGGGGESAVLLSYTPVIVAGGGGGAGGNYNGGAGGGGNDPQTCNGQNGASEDGILSAGAPQSGGRTTRGETGRNGTNAANGAHGGGGGGGGYFCGLANQSTGENTDSGGGGGSGWVNSSLFTDISGSQGVNSDGGKIKITYLGP